ncbi:MAG: riboflavin kinase [Chitinivibrionales bacterium]
MKVICPDSSEIIRDECAVTVGNFDGVHSGHRRLLSLLNKEAKARGLLSAVVTFMPHTAFILHPSMGFRELTPFKEKSILLESASVDVHVCLEFNREFMGKDPESFIRDILKKRLNAKVWIMGEDHGFGKKRAGSGELLQNLCDKNDIYLIKTGLITDSSCEKVASTRIRRLILNGEMGEAMTMLEYPFPIIVRRTRGIGKAKKMGFPTFNFTCSTEGRILPPHGTYAASLTYGSGFSLKGALYFGRCPSFSDREVHFEFFSVSDLPEEKPEKEAVLYLHSHIREEMRFKDERSLMDAVGDDIRKIRDYFGI